MPKKPKENIELIDVNFADISSEIGGLVKDHLVEGKKVTWDAVAATADIDFSEPAPNIIEWSVGKNFLNQPSIYHYKRQYQILRDLFNLRCVICNSPSRMAADCWDKGKEYLESENLLVWSNRYQDDVCPKCNTTRAEFEEDNIFTRYNTMVICVGMRAGKSVLAGAYLGSYMEHRIITLGDPATYFNVFPGQPFEVAFTATTADQAKGTIYANYRNARSRSPWIQSYIQSLRDEENKKGFDKNTLYKETEQTVSYKNINVEFNTLNSNSSGLAGRTRLFALIDELSRFDSPTEGSKRSGREVYNVLDNSLMTVRNKGKEVNAPYFFGMLGAVSSPISINDMTMKSVRDSKKVKSIFAIHLPTWKFNPDVTRESLEDYFKKDPIGAQRDFGANPPMAESPLITDVVRFRKAIKPDARPTSHFEKTEPVDGMGRAYVGKRMLGCEFDTEHVHYIAGDAGKSKDSFALVSGHGEWQDVDTAISNEKHYVTIIDWCLTIRPTIKPRRTVYFDCVLDIIKKLNQRQKIASITFDHWNSESIIQTIRNYQIDADIYCTKADDYIKFVSDCYEGKVQLLPEEPDDDTKDPYYNMSDAGRLIHELIHLERSSDLKKVDHSKNEHNDLATCVATVHKAVQESGMIKGFTGKGKNTAANLEGSAQQWRAPRTAQINRW